MQWLFNKKLAAGVLLGVSLSIGLFKLWPSSHPYQKMMEPYLLPSDHPIKNKLDALFSSNRVISNEQTLRAAGFEIVASTKWSYITVARHPDMPGFVFKLYLDTEKRTKQGIPHCEWLINRCIGAEKIRKIIQAKNLHYFTVPEKWLYVLPSTQQQDLEPMILVATDMELENKSMSSLAWKTRITKDHLDELYSILKEGTGSVYATSNIPYTKNGTFAFIDTEHPDKKVKLAKLIKYFSEENQQYWQKLTNSSP